MADALRLRTECVLADYLEYCARVPGSAPRPPSTPEAAVLRSVATHIQQRYQHVWSHYRGYPGNRIQLVTQVAREILHGSGGPTWGRVVALVTFAGSLLERTERTPRGRRLALKQREADIDRDCQSLVALLCDWLTGQHRAWLEAQGGWDGFCHFFTPVLISWRRLLVQVILSYFTATILTYLWTKLS